MPTVPGDLASMTGGLYMSNTGASLPGSGRGPSLVTPAVNPLQATGLITNPDTITPFDPFNASPGVPPERTSSLPGGFAFPSEFNELYENATNQVGSSDLTNQRESVTWVLANTVELGEPPKGSAMFVKRRPSQPLRTGRGKTIQTQEVYSLQQLNYILAVESANALAGGVSDMEIEGADTLDKLSDEYAFVGFYEASQPVLRRKFKAVVITNSGTYDEIPPTWPGRVYIDDHLGFVMNWMNASDVVGGKYTLALGKEKMMPPHATKILQILPVNFGDSKTLSPDRTEAFDAYGNYSVGKQLCIGASQTEISKPNTITKASFYSVGSRYTRDFHKITFSCGTLE